MQTTEEGNKEIGIFDGYEWCPENTLNGVKGVLCHPEKMSMHLDLTKPFHANYHESWNRLMPVVEKIEKLGFQFYIHNEGSYIRKWFYRGNFPDFGNVGENKIEATWQTVIQFIQWHNSNTSPVNKEQ